MVNVVLAQAPREGFHSPTTEEFNWPCVGPSFGNLFGSPVCLNRVSLLIILAAALVLVFFLITARRPQLVPGKRQGLVELVLDFMRNSIILEILGRDGLRFLPYLTTVFLFIFFGNLLGVIPPFLYSANASLAMPAFLALLTWVIFLVAGIRAHGLKYFTNTLFPPGVPWPIYLVLTPIEFLSVFVIRPLSLAIRLGANMIAGHLLLVVFLLGTEYMLGTLFEGRGFSITNVFAIGSFALALFLMLFELLVAGLQAFIFTILTAVYIGSSLEAEH